MDDLNSSTATRHIAIWIDDRQAILHVLESSPFDRSIPPSPSTGRSQEHLDAPQYRFRQPFYDAVLHHLEPQDQILILGPGREKGKLRRRIEQRQGLKGRVVGIYPALQLPRVELIFPTGGTWPAEGGRRAQIDLAISKPNPALFPGTGMSR